MATERWIGGTGQGLSWGLCFQNTDVSSLPNGNSVLSSQGDITNGTALDIFADVSFLMTGVTTVAPNRIDLFMYALNQDGSTYGDNALAPSSQTAFTPSPSLWCGSFVTQVGFQAFMAGMIPRIILPPGTFRFVVQNNLGVAFHSSTTFKYRTYNRSVA